LYLVVKDLLDLRPPRDPFDEKEVREFVRSVEDAFAVSDVIAKHPARYPGLTSLTAHVERYFLKEGFEQPFANLPGLYLRACDQAFEERWAPLIVGVLLRFAPYRQFIEEVSKRGGIDGELAFYLCLPAKAQKEQAEEWGDARYEKIDVPLQALAAMKNDDWPFFAVFQKALLRATADARKQYVVIPGKSEVSNDEFLNAWLEFLDEMWGRGLFAVRKQSDGLGLLWSGIALNPGAKTVKWSEATVSRLTAVVTLWWYVYAGGVQKIGSFLKSIQGPRGNEKYPGAEKLCDLVKRALRSVILIGQDDLPEDEVQTRTGERLRLLLECARRSATTGAVGTAAEPAVGGAEAGEK
jgi:hypothetical protein